MDKSNLNCINDEDSKNINQLGSIKLSVELKSSANKENTEGTLTVFSFLKNMYNPESFCGKKENGYERSVEISKLVNDLTDEDIENILKYIDYSNNDDIVDSFGEKKIRFIIYY